MILALPINLELTLPAHAACTIDMPPGWDPCGPCPAPVEITALAELAIVGWPMDQSWCDTLARLDVTGREGETMTVPIVIDERPWSVWAIARQDHSPWSCMSRGLALGPWPAGVPIQYPGPDAIPRFYDVAGRRLARPPPSGVYFVRIGRDTRKRLVLR